MIETILHTAPPIPMNFNPNMLTCPVFRRDAEYLLSLAKWLEKRTLRDEFRGFPATIQALKDKQQQFMELYERAKIKEREAKEKTYVKTNTPFYRYKLDNKDEQRIFERLDKRRQTSTDDQRHSNKVQKARKVS